MSEDINKHKAENEDAFDREAAEGFAMLGSEEEIASLKAETDAGFAQQFAQPQKTNSLNWVWAAAAVVVIGLGVSVFTVLQPEDKKDVAILQTQQAVSEVAPAPPEELSEAQETDAAKKEQRQEKPSYTPEFKTYANQSNDKAEPEAGFAMTSSSFTSSEPATPVVAANSYKNADADDREELAVAKKEEKTLRMEEASAEADVVQKENKKAKAASAPAKSLVIAASSAYSTDQMATDSITPVYYPAGIKQLRKDAKELLKGIALSFPLDIQLVLRNDGSVQTAKVLSKAVIDSSVVEAAQKALLKLPTFIVQRPAGISNPATYNFTLP